MTDTEIMQMLTPVLRDVFDDDSLVARRDLTAKDVKGWDSLGNIRLSLEVERAFSVRFSAAEITSLRHVGDLVDILQKITNAGESRTQ